MKQEVVTLILWLVPVYAVICAAVYFGNRLFMYFPDPTRIAPVEAGLARLPGHLPELIESIKPAVIAAQARQPSDLLAAAIEENVRLNVKRMHDDEPIVSEALAAKKMAAVGGVYDLATGKVSLV
jgi:carbonic anhydrase